MLPKIKRTTKEDFLFIIKNGKILHGSFFYLKYIKSEKPKYSFVFPKTLSKRAVVRNKYKRLGYNTLLKTELKPISGIFFYKKESILAKKDDLERDILNILNKI
jgi:ribonuclease P protein component